MADTARDIRQLEILEANLREAETSSQKIKELEKKIEERKKTPYSTSWQPSQYEESCKSKINLEKSNFEATTKKRLKIKRRILHFFSGLLILLIAVGSLALWGVDVYQYIANASFMSEEMKYIEYSKILDNILFCLELNIAPALILCFVLRLLNAETILGKAIAILFIIGVAYQSISVLIKWFPLARPSIFYIFLLIAMVVVFIACIIIRKVMVRKATKLIENKILEIETKGRNELIEAKLKDQEAQKTQKKANETLRKQITIDVDQYTQECNEYEFTLQLCLDSIRQNDILREQDKNLSTVSFVLNQLKNGRADSLKEALQRYDEKRERDAIYALERMEREWEREKMYEIEKERERQARIDREAQRERQERIDRENEELRKEVRKSLEDIKRSLDN